MGYSSETNRARHGAYERSSLVKTELQQRGDGARTSLANTNPKQLLTDAIAKSNGGDTVQGLASHTRDADNRQLVRGWKYGSDEWARARTSLCPVHNRYWRTREMRCTASTLYSRTDGMRLAIKIFKAGTVASAKHHLLILAFCPFLSFQTCEKHKCIFKFTISSQQELCDLFKRK